MVLNVSEWKAIRELMLRSCVRRSSVFDRRCQVLAK